jgi:hypothetical protein
VASARHASSFSTRVKNSAWRCGGNQCEKLPQQTIEELMMRFSAAMALAGVVVVGTCAAARADDTGVAGIHEWRHVGAKICFSDHYHDGSGSGSSQHAAMVDAVRAWQEFTVFEYGSDWGSYERAVGKSASCSASGASMTCHISAIPCKSGGVAPVGHRRVVRVKHKT